MVILRSLALCIGFAFDLFSVHTQNAGFGLPSTFTWMEKYLKRDSSLHGLAIFDGPEAAGNGGFFHVLCGFFCFEITQLNSIFQL